MKRNRKVKIVATLGPASSTYEMIRQLHEAGADVFRLNMSHGTHEEIAERHRAIRQVEKDLDSPIAILADLQGPKLRVGEFANKSEELEWGEPFRLDLDKTLPSTVPQHIPRQSTLIPGLHAYLSSSRHTCALSLSHTLR